MSVYTHECALCEEREARDYYAHLTDDFWLCQDCKDKMRVLLGIELKYGCEEHQERVRKNVGEHLAHVLRNGIMT